MTYFQLFIKQLSICHPNRFLGKIYSTFPGSMNLIHNCYRRGFWSVTNTRTSLSRSRDIKRTRLEGRPEEKLLFRLLDYQPGEQPFAIRNHADQVNPARQHTDIQFHARLNDIWFFNNLAGSIQ